MRKSVFGRSWGSRAREERGVAAVEFALVLPVLVLLLFGAITGGIAFSNGIGVTNAVREGARFGATADMGSGTWANDVLERIRETQFDDGSDAASSHTTVCVEMRGATSVPATCSAASIDPPGDGTFTGPVPATPDGCIVLVWARRSFHVEMGVFGDYNGVIHREAAARYERAC